MNDELKNKAETVFYFLTKNTDRESWIDFLEFCDCSEDDWEEIKKEIKKELTEKTGIKFNYL